MGIEQSAVHSVLIVAAFVLAAATVDAMRPSADQLAQAIRDDGSQEIVRLDTSIDIVNDPNDVPDSPIIIYVLNSGGHDMDPASLSVLYDGVAHTDLAIDVLGTAEDRVATSGDVIGLSLIGRSHADGSHRVQVVHESGVDDAFTYTYPFS